MLIEDLQLLHCVVALVEITAVYQQHILTDIASYKSHIIFVLKDLQSQSGELECSFHVNSFAALF